jgi:murein DD-endopeptidase MepM/ murein hydrolase activator NlpD
VRSTFVLLFAVLAPAGVRVGHGDRVSDVVDDGARIVRRDLSASANGADRQWVREVRDLVEDRLDVDALPPESPITVWSIGDELVAFTVDGHFAARARGGADEAERWAFDDGSTLDGPMLSRPVRYLAVASRIGVRDHPVTHRITWHAGTDYAAPIGTPVRAAKNGTVSRFIRSWTGGNILVVKHDDGSETKYMHLNARAPGIEEKVRVHQGQLIAFVGKTGRVTGPHLHFEYRDRFGYPVDTVVARWRASSRISHAALADLIVRRDVLRTYLADGARDWSSPLVAPAADVEAAPVDDETDPAVPMPAPVDRGERRFSRARVIRRRLGA